MAKVPYTPFPTEESGGGGGTPFSVRSSPDDFGAGVGKAVERLGNIEFDVANKFAEEASEAKANDILANQWSPETTKMRTAYDSLEGPDKVHGYEAYVNGLKSYQKGLIENETNPHTKKILESYTTGRVISDSEGAARDLAVWQKQFNNESTYSLIKSQNDYAAGNYNNPALVQSVIDQNDAQIERLYIDNGHDPVTPEGQAIIGEAQRTARGETATKLITRAVQTGDISTANSLRSEYGTVIPGYQQLHIDNLLGVENLKYTARQTTQALKSGDPLPQPMGAPPIRLQVQVANMAHSNGVDPNTALAYIRIESSDGTDLGKRGTIAQDKHGGTLDEQIARLPAQIKQNEQTATNALGRQAEAWEGYVVHQQGSGGGAALLRAVNSGDNRKAVDILKPFEDKEKGYNALAAVVENGGNSTMTAGDFVGFIKQRYEDCAKRAKCDFGNYDALNTKLSPEKEAAFQVWKAKYAPKDSGADYDLRGAFQAGLSPDEKTGHWPDTFKKPNHPTFSDQSKFAKDYPDLAGRWEGEAFISPTKRAPGQAILVPHETSGEAVQPAATPIQALQNFNKKAPGMIQRINEISNVEVRESVMKEFSRDKATNEAAAESYKAAIQHDAQQLAVKPDFTSTDQIPPELRAQLLDVPETMHYMSTMAEYNQTHVSGAITKDMREYGTGYFDLFKRINLPADNPNRITNVMQLQEQLGGPITVAGYKDLVNELSGTRTPGGKSEGEMKSIFLEKAKASLVLYNGDLAGLDKFGALTAWFSNAYQKARSEGKSADALLNPDSADYMGKAIAAFNRTPAERIADRLKDPLQYEPPKRTLDMIINEAKATDDPAKKAALKAEAVSLGLVRGE